MTTIRNTILAFMVVIFGAWGGAMASNVSPEAISGANTVSPAEAKALFDKGVLFVDVRKDADWDAGRIPGAEHLDSKSKFTAEALADLAAKNEEIVIYCNGPKCMRSSESCAKAVEWGLKKIHYFREGFPSWKSAGYPVE